MKDSMAVHLKKDRVKPYVFIIIAGIVSMISSLGAPLVPTISNYYHIPPRLGQWSLTIALISATVSIPILAKISRFGNYKNVIFITLMITAFGCLLSTFSPTFPVFLLGRALQGLGLGVVPSLMIAAHDSLSDSKKTLSSLAVTTAIGIGIAYPLSGIMATYVGIRATFFCGGVITLLAVIISRRLINLKKDIKEKFDIPGSILITTIISFLILLLSSLELHFDLKSAVLYFVGFSVSLFFWFRTSAKSINPIISLRVIMLPESLITNLMSLLSGVTIYMLITASMFRIQQSSPPGLSETPLMAGLVMTPMSIAALVSRYINFKLP